MDTAAFLESLIRWGVKLGLSTSQALRERAGCPDQAYPIVHVAGTNGKGSVCAMLAGACRQAGIRSGFYSSPHLVSVRERIRIDGTSLPAAEFDAVVADLRSAATDLLARDDGSSPTYFEFLTIAALLAFRRAEVQLGILEVGMGGRLDATNVVTPAVSVITHIDLDHMSSLGYTRAAVACEKAGIIKPGVPLVSGVRNPEAAAEIRRIAAERGAPMLEIGRDFDWQGWLFKGANMAVSGRCGDRTWQVCTTLPGEHQADNTAVTMAVLDLLSSRLGVNLRDGAGIQSVHWPARCQELSNGMLLDAAHNPSSIAALTATMERLYPNKKWEILFGAAADKDIAEVLHLLAPITAELHTVTIPNPRAATAEAIAGIAATALPGIPVTCQPSVGEALDKLAGRRILIAGSLFLAGAVLEHLHGPEPVDLF